MSIFACRTGRSLLLLLLAALALTPARALVLYDDPAGHDVNPGDGLPWDNVGANGVYLGSFASGDWVITANHVGAAGITLNGITYAAVAGSAAQIGSTDLLLYRIDTSGTGTPALANLTFSSFTPIVGEPVVLVGNGGSGIKRWGTNTVEQYGNYSLSQGGPTTVGLITDYDPVTGEAQGEGGDSGGALFYEYAPGQWWLSGILSGIGTSNGTQFTASVAIAAYYNQINAVVAIPEPSAWTAILGGTAITCCLMRRRRRA